MLVWGRTGQVCCMIRICFQVSFQLAWVPELLGTCGTLVLERGFLLLTAQERVPVSHMVVQRAVVCKGIPARGTHMGTLPEVTVQVLVQTVAHLEQVSTHLALVLVAALFCLHAHLIKVHCNATRKSSG